MNQALIFLLETFLGLFSLALLTRFYLQAVRAPARNPVSHFLAALTDFIVRPTRRVVPGLWGYDLSTLLLAWLTELLLVGGVLALKGYQFGPGVGMAVIGVMLIAALNLLKLFIYILMVAVFAQAILSFVAPRGPATAILASLTRPFLGLFQRRIPPVGGVDLSPLFVLVVCQILLMWPVAYLELRPPACCDRICVSESWYRYDADREVLTLILHVQPNAKRTEIAGLHGGHLKVRVAAPAVEGKANELLVGFLADKFDLPGGQVMIRRGSHGRTKTVEIYGQAACLLARAKNLLHS